MHKLGEWEKERNWREPNRPKVACLIDVGGRATMVVQAGLLFASLSYGERDSETGENPTVRKSLALSLWVVERLWYFKLVFFSRLYPTTTWIS
uniref:Phosphotransferase n=1 Tax=Steinernema glaseri TaxID=37863 RepID=A0A1I7YPG3_9BILA